jgi:hypothetical protein
MSPDPNINWNNILGSLKAEPLDEQAYDKGFKTGKEDKCSILECPYNDAAKKEASWTGGYNAGQQCAWEENGVRDNTGFANTRRK